MIKTKGLYWTNERVTLLTRLWKKGLSASKIAKKMGNTTRNAVIGKSHRLGLPGRPSPIKKKGSEGISMLSLTENTCAWPCGDPKGTDFFFCGEETLPGFPYCRKHREQAYHMSSKKRS